MRFDLLLEVERLMEGWMKGKPTSELVGELEKLITVYKSKDILDPHKRLKLHLLSKNLIIRGPLKAAPKEKTKRKQRGGIYGPRDT